jgi:hypothetical protein
VVEWVGLVASGFQFLLDLAAVFAEEVGGFFSIRSELVIISSIPPPVEITLGSKLHQSVAHW